MLSFQTKLKHVVVFMKLVVNGSVSVRSRKMYVVFSKVAEIIVKNRQAGLNHVVFCNPDFMLSFVILILFG